MKMMMKSVIAGALISLATVAAPGIANAAACMQQALSVYDVSGFTCTIGDKTFSNFKYTTSITPPGNASPDNAVTVIPIGGPPNWGFQFNGAWVSSVNGIGDAVLDYTVAVTSGAALINDADLSFNGTLVANSPDGQASVKELITGALCNGGLGLTVSQTKLADHCNFSPVVQIGIEKNIDASGNAAAISVVSDTASQTTVPEPASLAILGFSLLGMGAAYRRLRK